MRIDPQVIISRLGVEAILPHRRPMLLVEHVERLDDDRAAAIFYPEAEAWYLRGHFPDHPMVPLAILLEAMAQSAAVLGTLRDERLNHGGLMFLASELSIRARGEVKPDDRVEIELLDLSLKIMRGRGVGIASVVAHVRGQIVATAEIKGLVVGRPSEARQEVVTA